MACANGINLNITSTVVNGGIGGFGHVKLDDEDEIIAKGLRFGWCVKNSGFGANDIHSDISRCISIEWKEASIPSCINYKVVKDVHGSKGTGIDGDSVGVIN